MFLGATPSELRSCVECGKEFPIFEEDLPLYQKLDAPLPRRCFPCRLRRRLASYNRRRVYRRQCDATGKDIISWLSPDKPFKAYHRDAWYGDSWDPLDFGRDFDFSRPFFEQFYDSMLAVPMVALATYGELENSEYINDASFAKNCYLSYDFGRCEDMLYTETASLTKDAVDSLFVVKCELLYECIGCVECYNLRFSRFCSTCSDSWFLRDCVGCKNCFGCANIRNKEFWIFNTPSNKEDFHTFINNFDSGDFETLRSMKKKIEEIFISTPARAPHQVQTENCVGEWILRSKDLFYCCSADNSQDCRYCTDIAMGGRDCLDLHSWGDNIELIFNSTVVGEGAQRINCSLVAGFGVHDIDYSIFTLANSHHLFGCIGLRNCSHAIFNKKFAPAEYETLRAKIISHMKETGEWGEFFPPNYSYFGYNETIAQTYMPLDKKEVLSRGYKWNDYDSPPTGAKSTRASELPSQIDEVVDSALDLIFLCEKSGKPYKITKKELSFYRAHKLPLPRLHPEERHLARVELRRGYLLREARCSKCGSEIGTNYPEDSKQVLVCAKCYEDFVA